MSSEKVLVWLPSPLGDAVLCTPALRALREAFADKHITFYANKVVKETLTPSDFCDGWLVAKKGCSLNQILKIRQYKFDHAVLFKNSFSSALACKLSGINIRTGYVRDGRGWLLNDKLYPLKAENGKFQTLSMVDYYLTTASWLGCETENRHLELKVDREDEQTMLRKIYWLEQKTGPLVILVPGGAFGPSKCWPAPRFSAVADTLIEKHEANVIVSVSPNSAEIQIAKNICKNAKNELFNLGENPLSLGELKALFSKADLVITNDTGPRHIAIALGRNVVTLFGPNDPAWTETNYENEIEIIGSAPCVPCAKPVCPLDEHLCMKSISVDTVLEAAEKLLEKSNRQGQDLT